MTVFEVVGEEDYNPDTGNYNERYVHLTMREIGTAETFTITVTTSEYADNETMLEKVKEAADGIEKGKNPDVLNSYDVVVARAAHMQGL